MDSNRIYELALNPVCSADTASVMEVTKLSLQENSPLYTVCGLGVWSVGVVSVGAGGVVGVGLGVWSVWLVGVVSELPSGGEWLER